MVQSFPYSHTFLRLTRRTNSTINSPAKEDPIPRKDRYSSVTQPFSRLLPTTLGVHGVHKNNILLYISGSYLAVWAIQQGNHRSCTFQTLKNKKPFSQICLQVALSKTRNGHPTIDYSRRGVGGHYCT